jgi:hypoxanthine phosphoribosyltransferase
VVILGEQMIVKKKFYTWGHVEKMCTQLVTQLYDSEWKPDYIVGVTRGGNVPATILSNMTGIRCEAVKVALRDGESGKSGDSIDWMAQDALDGKKILVVDDINDTGATFQWIADDWKLNGDDNVRFAVLTENLSSDFDRVQYSCDEVNKAEEDVWLVYPWENVGEYHG